MNEMGPRRLPREPSLGSGHTLGTSRHPNLIDPIPTKRICFYKSGDPQFGGLRMVINSRTFKSFDALLDSLSKKVPLPFGVRNITTPRGVHAVHTLDELEDGKSYICSDSRKVKPINLAKASKKLPPWYHARPISARRRAVVQQARRRQQQRQRPVRPAAAAAVLRPRRKHVKQEPVAVRTPKRLTVFRNGDPTLRHTVILQRRTTPTFDSLLDYVSQMMQFHVVKLYTPDGRRVDGLPALILCSGTVVAAGREPFKASNYDAQKSPAPTWLPTNQIGPRRIRPMHRKKKSMTNTPKSRLFSPSSERHFLNQIRNSITGSSYDFPSHATGSVELETSHMLESVAETEGEELRFEDGAEGLQEGYPPSDDDIEKSFRVNQDGSMTVEMRVRLTVKEEETVHWTTTVTRSSVANQLSINGLPETETKEESNSIESNPHITASQVGSTEDPLLLEDAIPSEDENKENNMAEQSDASSSPRRAATPGPRGFRQERTSMESIKSVTMEGVKEDMVGSYSFTEQTPNGELTEQYCVVKQTSTRPVPKPRRFNSVDQSTFKSEGMAEILQVQNNGEEVTETVLHIYEQQTCQDNYLANSHFGTQDVSMSAFLCGRPATSDATQCSSSNHLETELGRPSASASELIGIWSTDNVSPMSDFPAPPAVTTVDIPPATKDREQKQDLPNPGNANGGASFQLRSLSSKESSQLRVTNKAKKPRSPKSKAIVKQVRRITSPGKRAKPNKADELENNKMVKPFSSTGFLKGIYGNKPKHVKSASNKNKHSPQKKDNKGVHAKSSESTLTGGSTLKYTIKDQNKLSPVKDKKGMSFEKNMLDVAPTEESASRGKLERQNSMHKERKNGERESDISECMSLPAFNSSSSVINEYVEHWLEKAQPNPSIDPNEDEQTLQTRTEIGSTSSEPDINCGTINTKAEQPLESILLLDDLPKCNVKQRIKSFENKKSLSSPPLQETSLLTQQINTDTSVKTAVYNCLPPSNNNSLEDKSLSPETPTIARSDSQVENKSTPKETSVPKTTVASSVPSTPLYLESSLSSLTSEGLRPVSVSPTSDQQPSPPPDCTTDKTHSPPTVADSPLSRNPSVRKARLVSNLSFEKKMSLRKASLEKSALTGDAVLEATSASVPVDIAIEHTVTLNSPVLNSTQQPNKDLLENTPTSNGVLDLAITTSSPSYCVSASPTSLASDQRASSASLSSDEDPKSTNNPLTETKAIKTQSHLSPQKVKPSPKLMVKTVKMENSSRISTEKSELPDEKKHASRSPSLERATPMRNASVSSNHRSQDENMSPSLDTKKIARLKKSPSVERKSLQSNDIFQKKLSPYSQSLEMLSPKIKSKNKLLSKNMSLDNAEKEKKKQTLKTSPSLPKRKEPQLENSTSMYLNNLKDENEQTTINKEKPIQEKLIETQVMPQPIHLPNQPNIEPVLEKLCYSIKSIRQITHNRPSCLEKSNSLPDFSGHVASTFGSSTKALLAFLSVMTLKEGLSNLNTNTTLKINANEVSCAEALKMIDSLKELANIEDDQKLKTSLSDLQKSTSTQLLQSWKGFKQLSEEYKSRTPTPNISEHECSIVSSNADENVIDEIIEELGIPDELKKELTAMPEDIRTESIDDGKIDAETIENDNKLDQNEEQNSQDSQGEGHSDKTAVERECEYEQKETSEAKCHKALTDVKDKHTSEEELPLTSPPGSLDDKDMSAKVEDTQSPSETDSEEVVKPTETTDLNGWKSAKKSSEESLERDRSEAGGISNSSFKVQSSSELELEDDSKDQPLVSNEDDTSIPEGQQQTQDVSSGESGCSLDVGERSTSEGEETDDKCQEQLLSKKDASPRKERSASPRKERYVQQASASDEEEHHIKHKELNVIIEESLSEADRLDSLEDQESQFDDQLSHEKFSDTSMLDKVSLEFEQRADCLDHTNTCVNSNNFIKIQCMSKLHRDSDVDEDSGNDHRSCGEQTKADDEQDLLSNEDKGSSSEEKDQERQSKKIGNCEKVVEEPQYNSEEKLQSVAERIGKLEKQVADSSQQKNSSLARHSSKKEVSVISDLTPPQTVLCTGAALQSSLSFSYDCSGVITREPEGRKVKSIKEMFMAKSVGDIQYGQRRFPSPNTSELSDYRTETSDSGGYQSQSSELSSGDDDSSRKSIAKGLVMRTIERLYGKKDDNTTSAHSESPPSAQKQKPSSIFSKVMSDLSYLSSTNSEAPRCITLHAGQVRPSDVTFDEKKWLGKENQIRKSISEPVSINKGLGNPPKDKEAYDEDTKEKDPYSLFNSKSDSEEKDKSKCIYFSVRQASDSDIQVAQGDQSTTHVDTVSQSKEESEETRSWAERNGALPQAELKKLDNKVHPLVDSPPDDQVIVKQPGKGHGIVRPQEPDMLDILYNFCGQNCPIL